jgi:hypothetical protein
MSKLKGKIALVIADHAQFRGGPSYSLSIHLLKFQNRFCMHSNRYEQALPCALSD